MLPIILIMPVVQLCVLVFAATYELKDVQLYIADQDQSEVSRQITHRFQGNPFFKICEVNPDIERGEAMMLKREVDLILTIPVNYGKRLHSHHPQPLQILVDAVNGSEANLRVLYTQSVLGEYATDQIPVEVKDRAKGRQIVPQVRFWYNHLETYIPFMLPGILCLMITALGMFLSSMSLVREKEIGTIEQINVSPIMKFQFVVGKLLPIGMICIMELIIGLAAAKWAFGVPFIGSFWTILALSIIFLIVIQSFGMFISTITNTQQQAMFVAWFFLVIFILLSGLFTPVESMPAIAQRLNHLNPLYWMVRSIRLIMLKGSSWADLSLTFAFLGAYAFVMFSIATSRYHKSA